MPNYSGRLAYSDKIKHFYVNSQTFDFETINDEIDLYFIDGDHSYEGVYNDTKKFLTRNQINQLLYGMISGGQD